MAAFDDAELSDDVLINMVPIEWRTYINTYRTTLRLEQQRVGDLIFYIPDVVFDEFGNLCVFGYEIPPL